MTTSTNPDTDLGTEFWRKHPHLFVPAHWGPQYCRCCLDPKRRKIHDVVTDSATHPGNCTGYRVAHKGQVGYSVDAWSDNGAACSYHMHPTYEDALEFVEFLKGGGDQGRVWDHYQIEERRYYTAVDTNVVVLS